MSNVRDMALHCEAKKHAYRQTQDGVVISLVLHPHEVPDGLATSPLGTRYMVALVEISDDEQPKSAEGNAQPERKDSTSTARAKRSTPWREMSPASQVAIRAGEQPFSLFLKEKHPKEWHETGEAEACVLFMLKVERKRDIETNQRSLMLWKQLDDQFEAWKRVA